MSALYPDVPATPGVPNVLRLPGSIENAIVPVITDIRLALATAPQWGIFDKDGNSLIDVDSVLEVSYQEEASISDYPIEEGTFASYNKVDRPYEGRVQVVKSGLSSDRTDFLQQIETLRRSTDVCTIVTPERIYDNANVVRFDYSRRSTEGAQAIVAELHLQEIRQTAQAKYSNTKDPSGADPVNDGSVQATTAAPPADAPQ